MSGWGRLRAGLLRLVAGGAYLEGMADDPATEYVTSVTPLARETAERLILIIARHAAFDAAIKWRQLTFALDGDFDHWICAV